ncbi:hypothetical protein AND_010619 [Anopheles darlingi]|uniref:TIL domain-containing protein n=1 Tax=Anopheles darlingi TaxID=43151 RepID=W5J0Z7_ANODA|nr:hypothetical protein AND_010619 [Anopheles darlingi]
MALHSGKLLFVLALVWGLCCWSLTTGQTNSTILSAVCPGPNEQYTDCGPVCGDRFCNNVHDASVHCVKSCGSGCYCDPGYARNKGYKCIASYLCPNFG